MKIRQAEFIGSFTSLKQLPARKLPEIAFAGRSNVGKSSLINRLLGRKNLARTSSTPGKTRQLNYILVNDAFYVVDLPGYGYAKVSRREKIQWQKLVEAYIAGSEELRCVVSIIDSRHGPTESDMELIEWLAWLGKPTLVVASKVDKLKQRDFQKARNRITAAVENLPVSGPMFFSAVSGKGKNELWTVLRDFLEA